MRVVHTAKRNINSLLAHRFANQIVTVHTGDFYTHKLPQFGCCPSVGAEVNAGIDIGGVVGAAPGPQAPSIHRALLGSLERFFGVLIEHFGGAFPVWLAPEQIAVIPVAEGFNDYARKAAAQLQAHDLRVSAELSDDRMNAKIRACQNRKIPYMLVVGQREAEEGTVSIRLRDGRQLPAMTVADFAQYALDKANTRSLEL